MSLNLVKLNKTNTNNMSSSFIVMWKKAVQLVDFRLYAQTQEENNSVTGDNMQIFLDDIIMRKWEP